MHRNKLPEAIHYLEDALELCPKEKAVARDKIRRYAAIVKAELQREGRH